MWMVGSLATAKLGWDRSRSLPLSSTSLHQNYHHYLLPLRRREACRLYRYNVSAAFPLLAGLCGTPATTALMGSTASMLISNARS